jgi:hypothetical protein
MPDDVFFPSEQSEQPEERHSFLGSRTRRQTIELAPVATVPYKRTVSRAAPLFYAVWAV